jgi:two-component system, sensor histidine kinase PdtaS
METPIDPSREVEKLRRHVQILYDLGRLAAATTDIERLFDQVVVHVARAVEIDHVKVLQYRKKTADFLVVAGIGWREGVVRAATLPADLQSAPGRSFLTAEPVVVHNFPQQSDVMTSDFLALHGIVALANAPIMIDGAAWGVLEVDSTSPREFGHDTTEFLMAAGAIIGSVLRRHVEAPGQAEKLAMAAAELKRSDMFLRELQHRVKNSFQLILSAIAMQKRRHAGTAADQALNHVAGRINAIALAHDQLALRDGNHVVRLSDYLRALCLSLKQQVDNVDFEIEADDIDLSIDRAVPVGLILNEAATNAIKHAFGEAGGRITVKLVTGLRFGQAQLTIADNGKGVDAAARAGSGRTLIAGLARQIGGTVGYESTSQGTAVALTFPVVA